MNKKHLAAYAAVAALFGVMGAVVALYKKAPAPVTTTMAATGGAAHSAVANLYTQSLNDLAGKPQSLAQWKGKPLLVNFWATWCGPCVREMPELSHLAGLEAGKRFNVIGIGIDSPTNMSEFAAKHEIAYPLYVAGMGGTELSRELGNKQGGLPYTVLIGADGQVIKTYLGELKFDELRADLDKLNG
jgi:thiol-disulfide isomerase/thioredoxin